jgi:hypothetical protein
MLNTYLDIIFADTNLNPAEINKAVEILGFNSPKELVINLIQSRPPHMELNYYLNLVNQLIKDTVVA